MADTVPARVLIAEDHFLTRFGTLMLLRTQPDLDVVGEAEDGAQAVSMFEQFRPDVTLLDLKLPVMSGLQVITNIRTMVPDARILVLTHYDGDEDIFRAVKAGAMGYLTKEVKGEEILTAIRTILAGRRYLPAEVASRLAERLQGPSLSPREQQVLEHLCQGRSNREIATALNLTVKTASFYVSGILSKLGAKSRTEAVSIATQRGMLSRM